MIDVFHAIEEAMKQAFGQWLKPVQHADVVLQVYPKWASAKTLRALTGLNRTQLDRFCDDGLLKAKLCGGSVVYCVEDVLKSIDGLPDRKEARRD